MSGPFIEKQASQRRTGKQDVGECGFGDEYGRPGTSLIEETSHLLGIACEHTSSHSLPSGFPSLPPTLPPRQLR